MKWHKILLADHGGTVYGIFIVACTLVLTFSMPWASRLSELITLPWQPFPLTFFLVYAFLSGAMALNRGASAVPNEQNLGPEALSLVLVRIAFGQLLVLPLVTYSRVLFPGEAWAAVAAVGHVLLVSLFLGYLGMLLEIHSARRGRSSGGLRYGFLMLYSGMPLLFLPAAPRGVRSIAQLSPMGAIRSLIAEPAGAAQPWLVFLVPALLAVLCFAAALSQCRRSARA